jgi:uncharacterized protein (DUF4415 family)
MTVKRGNMNKADPEMVDDENPEWTDAMFAAAMPFSDLSLTLKGKLRGRPRLAAPKERITIRLSRDVVDQFRAGGAGWQTRMDAALKEWLAGKEAA